MADTERAAEALRAALLVPVVERGPRPTPADLRELVEAPTAGGGQGMADVVGALARTIEGVSLRVDFIGVLTSSQETEFRALPASLQQEIARFLAPRLPVVVKDALVKEQRDRLPGG